jgi:signal transduction histidine kinase
MNARDPRLLPLTLNVIGMAVVAFAFFRPGHSQHGAWLALATVVALASWAVVVLVRFAAIPTGEELMHPRWRNARRVAAVTGIVASALGMAPSDSIHMAPLAVILIAVIWDEYESIWFGALAATLAFALTPIGCLLAGSNTQTLLSYLAANAVWVLVGVSRRQSRIARRRRDELETQQQELREQDARAGALAARQAAARDIHDVLAHSLGGLVIQLDAAEALLESGRAGEAQAKVAGARALAADGLADARRAVAALRSPDDSGASEQTSVDLAGAVERLLRAHRELGGRVEARLGLDAAPPLAPRVASAFERALQESLSNARRHAPGEPVAVELLAADGRLALTVSNPMRADRAHSDAGGGHGLIGMAERFAALDGGSAAARERDGRFVVNASACLVPQD